MSLLSILLFPFYIIFFWILDVGKEIFFTTLFGTFLFLLVILFLSFRRRKRKVFKALFCISLFCLIFYSVFLNSILSINRTYHPAIGPNDGVTSYTIDYPRKGLDNIYRVIADQWEGKGEKYVIQGWLDNDTLIYKKWQGWTYNLLQGSEMTIGPEHILQYNITTRTSSSFLGKTDKLENKTCEYADCVKDLISTPDYPHGCSIGYVSPYGNRIACIAKHTYGPQDIIILER